MNQHLGVDPEDIAEAQDFDLRPYADGVMKYIIQLTTASGLAVYVCSHGSRGVFCCADISQAEVFLSSAEAEECVKGSGLTYAVLGFVETA